VEQPEERADELLKEADKAGQASEELEDEIQRTKSDWEAKKSDSQVPGALEEQAAGEGGDESD
jgi:hypothetical protein